MWLTGLGTAFDVKKDLKEEGDVFWLIPGDYKYKDSKGKDIFDEMVTIPNTVLARECDLCIGEIDIDTNSSKHLIDTYGTYGLLANWFPNEAQQIRKLTSKPRTEFFAVSRSFLRDLLDKRWYAYEQTLVMLLHCYICGRKVKNVFLGEMSDAAQGRDSLAGAIWENRFTPPDAQRDGGKQAMISEL
jgi:hypothetical protein